jgi:hypothetical protein
MAICLVCNQAFEPGEDHACPTEANEIIEDLQVRDAPDAGMLLNEPTGVTCPNCGDIEMHFGLNEQMILVRQCGDCGHEELTA